MGDKQGEEEDGSSKGKISNEMERIREITIAASASASVFPGFRFSPTDDELISYYLKKKLQGSDKCVDIIPEVDLCRHEPWDLPALSIIRSDNEWFFFSTRGKKYPNGSQSKRATQFGYWKATGKERKVKSGAVIIGTKRTLVFHTGRAPKGERTEWIMHEYCTSDTTQESLVVCRLKRNSDFRLAESSRGSPDHRNLSTVDNADSGTNEYTDNQRHGFDGDNDNTQTDGFQGDNTRMDGSIKSRSKGSTSSYRAHSVRQNDSESESNQQPIPESPHGSSSPYKEGNNGNNDNDDDCFADIINDDIIKLDESTSQSVKFQGVFTGSKIIQKLPQETASTHMQGTAVRRIKLRHQKGRKHGKPPISPRGQNQHPEKATPGCVVSALSGGWVRPTRLIPFLLCLVVVMFLVWQGNYLNSKQHLGTSMEVIKKQLIYWLHKPGDNM